MPKYSVYDIDWNWYLLSSEEIPLNYNSRVQELERHFGIMSIMDCICAIEIEIEYCDMHLN